MEPKIVIIVILCILVAILTGLIFYFSNKYENERQKSKFAGEALELTTLYLGKIFLPVRIFEGKINMDGGTVYLLKASVNESISSFLFEISEKDFHILSECIAGTQYFILKTNVLKPGRSQFYFERYYTFPEKIFAMQ